MAGQRPGLQNFIERSVILTTGAVLNGSLPELTGTLKSSAVTLEEAERSHILQTLEQTEGVGCNLRSPKNGDWTSNPESLDLLQTARGCE
jgi:hypothetical protein